MVKEEERAGGGGEGSTEFYGTAAMYLSSSVNATTRS